MFDEREILQKKVSQMPGISFQCSCGQQHSVNIEGIYIYPGAINDITKIVKDYKKVFIMCDDNTWECAGSKICTQFNRDNISYVIYKANTSWYHMLVPDEETVDNGMKIALDSGADFILGVGSGTINDVCKYIASQIGTKCMIFGTAPSMDGYASSLSALIREGHKVTVPSKCPDIIMCDGEIMKDAPKLMLKAGFGDIMGKYVSLADWELAKEYNNEHYCPLIAEMIKNVVDICAENAEKYFTGDVEAVSAVCEALVLSGVAISMMGTTRAASGSEHHFSHFWELEAIASGEEHPFHGISVAMGTIASANIYNKAMEIYPELSKINFPSPDFIHDLFEKSEMAVAPEELGMDRNFFNKSIKNAYKVRERYTIYSFLVQRKMLDEIADKVTEEICKG